MGDLSKTSVFPCPFPERGGNSALRDSGSGRRDWSSHQEAEGLGGSSAGGKEPADPLRHRLHSAGAARSGAHHWGVELPLGYHHPAAHRSHRCRYCGLLRAYACVYACQRVCECRWKGSVWWNEVRVQIFNLIPSLFLNELWVGMRPVIITTPVPFHPGITQHALHSASFLWMCQRPLCELYTEAVRVLQD